MSNPWDMTISKIVLDNEAAAFFPHIPTGNSIADRRAALVLWLLINTGIRASELCRLRVKDCPASLGANFIEVWKGKRRKCRNVPVSQAFADYIARYIIEVRPMTMPRRLGRNSGDGWLLYKNGQHLDRFQVYYLVDKTAALAGITKRISPHKWRHRFATRALAQDGSNVYRVKSWLGHSSLTTTEKYLHLAGMLSGAGGECLDQCGQYVTAI